MISSAVSPSVINRPGTYSNPYEIIVDSLFRNTVFSCEGGGPFTAFILLNYFSYNSLTNRRFTSTVVSRYEIRL